MLRKRVLVVGAGYVGSYLASAAVKAGHDVVCCDAKQERLTGFANANKCELYQNLKSKFISDFDVILWFAGHSSVPASIADPQGALRNNCLDLFEFAKNKRTETRLIYASTGSIYSSEHGGPQAVMMLSEDETRLNPINPYDCSKVAFDAMATCFVEGLTGLRLGTICGFSKFLRPELIFNSMNLSALRDKEVRVANTHASRAILFLDDLAFYVNRMIENDQPLPKILNAASYNITVGALGTIIADYHNVPIRHLPDTRTYSFQMNCDAIQKICGVPKERSIAERCKQFSAEIFESGWVR